MNFPTTPASGRLKNQPFQVQRATLENNILTLRQGKEFLADLEVSVFLHPADGEPLDGKSFTVKRGGAFDDPGVSLSGMQMKASGFEERYLMKLVFDRATDGTLPGRIYLCVNDSDKSFVAGTFTASVGAAPGASSGPPAATDAPFIQGKVAVNSTEEKQVTVEYLGSNDKGDQFFNGVGILYQAGSSASSTTFAPRVTSINFDSKRAGTYSHVHLPPGRYLAFVKWKDDLADWRWVDVAEKAQLTIDFAIDPANVGKVEVSLPPNLARETVRLIPLDADGKLPSLKLLASTIAQHLNTEAKPQDGKAVYEGLRAGSYRVLAGDASADVQVSKGATARADLSKGK